MPSDWEGVDDLRNEPVVLGFVEFTVHETFVIGWVEAKMKQIDGSIVARARLVKGSNPHEAAMLALEQFRKMTGENGEFFFREIKNDNDSLRYEIGV